MHHWVRSNTIKREAIRADSHRDLYAPTRIFSCNTALKSRGRRQPCRGSLSCLTEKSRPLECSAVLNRRFFLRGVSGDCRNTVCILKSAGAPMGKKIHSKPCKSLCESAQVLPFSLIWVSDAKIQCCSPLDCCLPPAKQQQHHNFLYIGKNMQTPLAAQVEPAVFHYENRRVCHWFLPCAKQAKSFSSVITVLLQQIRL